MKKLLLIMILLTMVLSTRAQAFDFNEVTYTPEQTTFRLFASADAKAVKLRLYQAGFGGKALKTLKMQYADGLWTASVKGNLKGRFYTFDTGYGECAGVFAKAVGVNGKRGVIIDMNETNPEHWNSECTIATSPLPATMHSIKVSFWHLQNRGLSSISHP